MDATRYSMFSQWLMIASLMSSPVCCPAGVTVPVGPVFQPVEAPGAATMEMSSTASKARRPLSGSCTGLPW